VKGNRSVIVVGAGVSGLTTAFWLRKAGFNVTIFEKEAWPGGTMRTTREGEWLIETGPNSALETTPLFGEMFEALGIISEREYADPSSSRRYILRNGQLHPLPMSPGLFLTSRLWTPGGKLRLLKEPFIGRAGREETIAEFVERRLGKEFLDYAINPFVAGVYAGNPENLSVRSAFPKLYALEEKYGGLIRGMIGGARERKKRAETAKDRARMFSFRSGMQTFPEALARNLGGRLRLSAAVRSIESEPSSGRRERYVVRFEQDGTTRAATADAVVLSVPAAAASRLVQPFSAPLAEKLKDVYYPPVAEVFLGYRLEQMTRPLDGFGFLIPEKEKREILGTIWSSAIFTNRAPAGYVALTSFVGGSRQPEILDRDDDRLLETVKSELRGIMGVQGEPALSRVIRWERAIPQYTIGYGEIIDEINRTEDRHPGLFFCSNYRGGIAVGDCVMNGEKIAGRIRTHLANLST
jgi:oxygen-dependent protoporphyrinogen oxidase